MKVTQSLPLLFLAVIIGGIFYALPYIARAQAGGNVDAVANAQCAAEVIRRAAMQPPIPPPPSPPFPCAGPHTSGHCFASICKSEKYNAGAGNSGGASGLDQVAKILGDLMSKLMQGKPPGGGAPPPSAGGGAGGAGCAMQQTNDQSLAQANPQCYTYVAPTSAALGGSSSGGSSVGTSDISGSLLQSLGGSSTDNSNTNTNTTISSTLSNATQATVSNTSGPSSQPIISVTQTTSNLPQANLTPGLSGNIQFLNNGGTILAGNVDTSKNSSVSGFFGTDSFNGQPQGVVGGLCQSRPWASFFLSYVIPSAFFDSLCVLKGYTVGTPAPAQTPTVTVVQSAPKTISTTPAASTVPPKVNIWASPASVVLGARTSVFWTSQGVSNCTETSPDGNFSQATLQGAASTAPITGATVFTISCVAPDGSHVTSNTTVNLSI